MGDYLIALFFWMVYEAFSWPMRLVLQPAPMAPDIRRMLSRVAGPVLICFVAWFFSRFLVPIGFITIWLWYAAAFGAAVWVCRRLGHKPDWRAVFSPVSNARNKRREWIIEAIGFFTFFGFLYFRRLAPEMTTAQINSGLAAEKFDNAMLFWSSFFTVWTPPDDYWMSGKPQAYYYFGHFFWAWIGRATLLPGEWLITLAMSRLALLVYEGAYLLVRSFGARSLGAAIGAFFVAWGGNPLAVQKLHLQYNVFSGRAGQPEDERKFILASEYRSKVTGDFRRFLRGYDWWKPSRAMRDEDITEFLAWTAILGDFHAHHLSIPWMLAWIAIVLAGDRWFKLRRAHCLKRPKRKRKEEDGAGQPLPALTEAEGWGLVHRSVIWTATFIVLGVASIISNLWMAPVVGLASLGILFWRTGWGVRGLIYRTLLIPSLAAAMLLGVYMSKGSVSAPVDSLKKPVDESKGFIGKLAEKSPIKPLPKTIRSTVPMLARHWGFHVGILTVAFIAMASRGMGRFVRGHRVVFGAGVLIFIVELLWFRWKNSEPSLLWIGFAALMLCFAWGRRPGFRPLVTAYICGGVLLLGALEVFFFDDAYDGAMERYNSYFKFSYPVWPVLGAAAFMCAQRLWYWTGLWPVKWAFRASALALVPFVMVMSVIGFPARTVMARWDELEPRPPTLNAVDWLEHLPAWQAEGRMLHWIRDNIPPRTRIAESNDPKHGAYGFQGRVASLAGRPIPLGWTHHEHQWRGFSDPLVDQQYKLVEALYNSATAAQVLAAAHTLGVEWVVIGKVEKEAMGPIKVATFYKAIRAAAIEWQGFPANNPEVHLFRLPQGEPPG